MVAEVIAEIGINHNGDVKVALELISVAAHAGCTAVKFQKRTPNLCVPLSERDKKRETPWGTMSYMEYKERIEFWEQEYLEIDRHCRDLGIEWFASPWDIESVQFLEQFSVPRHKIASASLTDDALLTEVKQTDKPVILSTGMSTLEEVDRAVELLGTDRLTLLHTNSTYPCDAGDVNLRTMRTLSDRYQVPVGYSGHERGLQVSLAAVALGAVMIERHVTLDRTMWGSDHSASLEPDGLARLVRDIRVIESSLGDGIKRVYPGEEEPRRRLRSS